MNTIKEKNSIITKMLSSVNPGTFFNFGNEKYVRLGKDRDLSHHICALDLINNKIVKIPDHIIVELYDAEIQLTHFTKDNSNN